MTSHLLPHRWFGVFCDSDVGSEIAPNVAECRIAGLIGKTAIVTGVSKGIGSGIATALASEGARVAVN